MEFKAVGFVPLLKAYGFGLRIPIIYKWNFIKNLYIHPSCPNHKEN